MIFNLNPTTGSLHDPCGNRKLTLGTTHIHLNRKTQKPLHGSPSFNLSTIASAAPYVFPLYRTLGTQFILTFKHSSVLKQSQLAHRCFFAGCHGSSICEQSHRLGCKLVFSPGCLQSGCRDPFRSARRVIGKMSRSAPRFPDCWESSMDLIGRWRRTRAAGSHLRGTAAVS